MYKNKAHNEFQTIAALIPENISKKVIVLSLKLFGNSSPNFPAHGKYCLMDGVLH
jgi:hypothetical protein